MSTARKPLVGVRTKSLVIGNLPIISGENALFFKGRLLPAFGVSTSWVGRLRRPVWLGWVPGRTYERIPHTSGTGVYTVANWRRCWRVFCPVQRHQELGSEQARGLSIAKPIACSVADGRKAKPT